MVIETTKLYVFISVLVTLTFIESHSGVRNQKKRLENTHKICSLFFFALAILIGTIDFCHSLLVSLTFTFPEGHNVSTQ